MAGGTGEAITWAGGTITAGSYISAVRTYTYKGAGPVYYDMVYTANAHGQPEKTYFIHSDDSTTKSSTKFYNWRGGLRRLAQPDGSTNIDFTYDDNLRMTWETGQVFGPDFRTFVG